MPEVATTVDARACFLRACELDVEVRKPGNVSWSSPGHGMQAAMFVDSAEAAAGPLFETGLRVGERIEAAVEATWAAVGCNTNLGILLLCAPIALAVEREPASRTPGALRQAVGEVLNELDVDDARAAYRAIARANPGGLGTAPAEDVRQAPRVGLRAAMSLAAERDLIARQYRDGYADLFERALPRLPSVFSPMPPRPVDLATTVAVQQLYLSLLSVFADSHIVRKHGEPVAQNVMVAAQGFARRAAQGGCLDADPAFMAWDSKLKARGINPGTTADFTVATLMVAGLTRPLGRRPEPAGARWHGS
ncbi:triphosphoribosyl-dephospho-CoA synthase [Ideonella sp.]|uniref:triphosphoribosyl-dephospho-CoA synthase n=1 Tax=Ideonella sp. TaxID=1929293 RepID=UPI002B4957C9|nr:triphosphoribosyl-dephospho-CoA synthase [Ideonella sp.]HJV72139.1 triphosphoribosyl-dephospho-CoA synthase [Ideonella sp.]